jgi:hypothetical protein
MENPWLLHKSVNQKRLGTSDTNLIRQKEQLIHEDNIFFTKFHSLKEGIVATNIAQK